MADVEDQIVVGSTCMKYRRQSRGVLLINDCDREMVFAVETYTSSAGDHKPMIVDVSVAAKSSTQHSTGGSEKVISVSIGNS